MELEVTESQSNMGPRAPEDEVSPPPETSTYPPCPEAAPPDGTPDDFFRTLFEEAPFGIVMSAPDFRFQQVNASLCRILGYTREELMGKSFYDITHPEDIRKSERMAQTLFKGQFPVKYVKRFVCRDGSLIWAAVTNSAVYDENGQLRYAFGMLEDISRQRELESLRHQMAAIVESSSDAIFSLNSEGAIQTWNRGAERICGRKCGEIVGQHFTTLFPQEGTSRESFACALEKARRGNSIENFDTVFLGSEGNEIPMALTVSAIRDDNDLVSGMAVIARDMTVHKRTLSALRESESRMRLTSETLARTNKELEHFAFVASHDLQEPLRTIAGFLQLIEIRYKGKLDTDADEFIEFAVQGAKRMQCLINDLLHFSRSTRQNFEFSPISCNDMLQDALSNLKGPMEAYGVTLTNSGLPVVLSCQRQLAQVFQNLISNAIKFRGSEPLIIKISSHIENNEWLVEFRDNGIGFDMEHAERIFLIFQRLHSWDRYPGTGVGLAICKKIIENHGGRIWATSEVGRGSTFFFTLPRYTEEPRQLSC